MELQTSAGGEALPIFKNIFPDAHVHFIGIGGKGLNGIARICLELGFRVSGSDKAESTETKEIQERGGTIYYGHTENNVPLQANVVVYSSIILPDCPELLTARRRKIPILKRSAFLKLLLTRYKKNISVSGSHGKSTTTALIGLALLRAGADPTIFGGAYTRELGGYERLGHGSIAVTEACEYDRSFYDLVGDISVITALEKSHMEFYKTEENMTYAFKEYISRHTSDSVIFYNGDNALIRKLIGASKGDVYSYGFSVRCDYQICDVIYRSGASSFSVKFHGEYLIQGVTVYIPGSYNVLNFTATLAVLHYLGYKAECIRSVADNFFGVSRRFEIHAMERGVTFVDDFSHHPSQVKCLIGSLHQFFPKKKIHAIFQPRQFHLIKTFLKEYGEAFVGVNTVYVTDIMSALNDSFFDQVSLTVADVIQSIKTNGKVANVIYVESLDKAVAHMMPHENIVIATIGAGDVYKARLIYQNAVYQKAVLQGIYA